jgi:hypothetical protein
VARVSGCGRHVAHRSGGARLARRRRVSACAGALLLVVQRLQRSWRMCSRYYTFTITIIIIIVVVFNLTLLVQQKGFCVCAAGYIGDACDQLASTASLTAPSRQGWPKQPNFALEDERIDHQPDEPTVTSKFFDFGAFFRFSVVFGFCIDSDRNTVL